MFKLILTSYDVKRHDYDGRYTVHYGLDLVKYKSNGWNMENSELFSESIVSNNCEAPYWEQVICMLIGRSKITSMYKESNFEIIYDLLYNKYGTSFLHGLTSCMNNLLEHTDILAPNIRFGETIYHCLVNKFNRRLYGDNRSLIYMPT